MSVINKSRISSIKTFPFSLPNRFCSGLKAIIIVVVVVVQCIDRSVLLNCVKFHCSNVCIIIDYIAAYYNYYIIF